MAADNQQERFINIKFDENFKWYLAGFVDGEGSFCLSIKKRPSTKFGWGIDPGFYLYQHEKNKWILELAKKFFNHGSIHRKSSPYNVFTYKISGIRPVFETVIPFFRHYKLLGKNHVFELFCQGVEKLLRKEHFYEKGFKEIIDIAYQMNQMGKGKKWDKNFILGKSSTTIRTALDGNRDEEMV